MTNDSTPRTYLAPQIVEVGKLADLTAGNNAAISSDGQTFLSLNGPVQLSTSK